MTIKEFAAMPEGTAAKKLASEIMQQHGKAWGKPQATAALAWILEACEIPEPKRKVILAFAGWRGRVVNASQHRQWLEDEKLIAKGAGKRASAEGLTSALQALLAEPESEEGSAP